MKKKKFEPLMIPGVMPHDKPCDVCGAVNLPRFTLSVPTMFSAQYIMCVLCAAAAIESVTRWKVINIVLYWLKQSPRTTDMTVAQLAGELRYGEPYTSDGAKTPRKGKRASRQKASD